MKVCFRVDASIEIGTGHVMRCLTLAEALRKKGVECSFLCRPHTGNLIEFIRSKNFHVYPLGKTPAPEDTSIEPLEVEDNTALYATWLGCNWETDAQESGYHLQNIDPDWLVVDHYALDQRWELALKAWYKKLAVIDDLADRVHASDFLLDQTLGRNQKEYAELVPKECDLLLGAQYALLRPEFARWREYSLKRRSPPQLNQILITLGGVDKNNATGQILNALTQSGLSEHCKITVIMGSTAPHLADIQSLAKTLPWQTEVKINVSNMAELMANSDLAIGAAGGTSWERCCLGLPTLMVVLAENQSKIARALADAEAAILLGRENDILGELGNRMNLLLNESILSRMSRAAFSLNDGSGLDLVVSYLVGEAYE